MKILTDKQIREADLYTIKNEPIRSVDLMERASQVIADWICEHVDVSVPFYFVIGKGNNGGDGLAVARLLYNAGYRCRVNLVFEESLLSEDSRINLNRLPAGIPRSYQLDDITPDELIVDALLGTGVKGMLKAPLDSVISHINDLPNQVLSIDLPSGMRTEFGNSSAEMIRADITLTLEFPKLAMLLPESGDSCGEMHVLPFGLDQHFIAVSESPFRFITENDIVPLLFKRRKFSHKGTYGHALLICGAKGMTGAAVLAVGGALRSGCGLVTVHLPEEERFCVHSRFPSAMVSIDRNSCFSELPETLEKYTAIGVGPGLGQKEETVTALTRLLKTVNRPIVLDADALNILAAEKEHQQYVPEHSVLTPHPGELKRLVGEWHSEEEKIRRVREFSLKLDSVIVVKGAYTMVCNPGGICYFNSTGNSGMAKGGSGDVLTGFLTGLLARGYEPETATVLAVYFHGRAGDLAMDFYGKEGMNSEDIINFLNAEC